MDRLSSRLGGVIGPDSGGDGCGCQATFDGDRLRVVADDCDADGRLAASPECRRTVISRLAERDVELVRTLASGVERVYEGEAVALLVAAGRFVEAVDDHDERLAERARRDPVAAAREATGRAGAVATLVAETGLAEVALPARGYETVLAPLSGLALSDWRVDTAPPPEATLADVRELETGATVRRYERDAGRGAYVLVPPERGLDPAETALLGAAYERLASGAVTGGDRAAGRAIRAVAAGAPDESLVDILRKHTRGHGLLEDLFADPDVSDVFASAPAHSTPVSVRIGERTLPTNVRLTERGVDALVSRYRRESGRGFSRADPTLDAATQIGDRQVRVAGVTEPASEGTGFAFRAHDREAWRLTDLLANGTLTPGAAGLLSVATERGSAVLLAGPRGAGKTTLLGALLWELPPDVRTVVIEDTPELPAGALRTAGRDVQRLRASDADTDLSRSESVRTALRLGDGALVVGEIRGQEAAALYEAMRVGANSESVLGTVHGDGADAVYERVVSDLGVPPSSFGVTDLIVTLERTDDGSRRVRTIEETLADDGSFASLYDCGSGSLSATGRLDRGRSRVLEDLSRPSETYERLREALSERTASLAASAGVDTGGTR